MKELERLQVWAAPRLRLFALAFALILASFQVAPSTLETTLGQMAPPKRGRVQECHLIHVAF